MQTYYKFSEEEWYKSIQTFTQNAFLFVDNADRILADRRMAMAAVPVSNGIAYMGGFGPSILAVFLDWWLESGPDCVRTDEDGNEALTWRFAGSPLSGMNSRRCVYRDGRTAPISHGNFSAVWHSFSEVCKKYREEKRNTTDAFTIEEVVSILKHGATDEVSILQARLEVQKEKNARIQDALKQVSDERDELYKRYESLYTQHHLEGLKSFRRDLINYNREIGHAVQDVNLEQSALRKEFHEGKHSIEEHKSRMMQLKDRRIALEQKLAEFRQEGIDRLAGHDQCNVDIVKSFLRR